MSMTRGAASKKQHGADLALREMILGVLKAKAAKNGSTAKIHATDFRAALGELGFPMGSPVIENILVHCRLDSTGGLDFSELEKSLTRERRLFNAEMRHEPTPLPTSTATPVKPWRGDAQHHAKLEMERQSASLTEHADEVNALIHDLSHKLISSQQIFVALASLGINPTKEFCQLAKRIEFEDIPYATLIRSLTRVEVKSVDLTEVASAGAISQPHPSDIPGLLHKRSLAGRSTAFEQTVDGGGFHEQYRPHRKMQTSGPLNAKIMFGKQQVSASIATNDNTVPILSHTQADMVVGVKGDTDTIMNGLRFNAEQRLQREQVLAALRKLDGGMITVDDFQSLLYSLGIDMPETFVADVRRAVACGRLDIRKFVRQMDAEIFKNDAAEGALPNAVVVKNAQKRLSSVVLATGGNTSYGLVGLMKVMREVDSNGDGLLTFTELMDSCRQLHLLPDVISEEELRLLFHAWDVNGDGVLSMSEFINGIRGPVSPIRGATIRKIFQRLDRYGTGSIPLDTLIENFNASAHPEVQNGESTAREVTVAMIAWFSGARGFNGNVEYNMFEEYISNMTIGIRDEKAFEHMAKECWQITDFDAAPQLQCLRHGVLKNNINANAPKAMQTHGNLVTWGQEASVLEVADSVNDGKTGKRMNVKEVYRNFNSDVVRWLNHHNSEAHNCNRLTDDVIQKELRAEGVSRINRRFKNQSNAYIIGWNERDLPPAAPVPIVPKEDVHLPYQNEFSSAGGLAARVPAEFSHKRTVDTKVGQLNSKPFIPFGTTLDVPVDTHYVERTGEKFTHPLGIPQCAAAPPTPPPKGVKSLADILVCKGSATSPNPTNSTQSPPVRPKSLASYYKNQ